jgi:hypothetical protein
LPPAPSGAGFVVAYVLTALDEVADDGYGPLRGIGGHRMPAIRKPFELQPNAGQAMNGIVLAAEHESRTLDACPSHLLVSEATLNHIA